MITVRPAVAEDVSHVYTMIRDLARYEKAEHAVTGTQEDLARNLFGVTPRVFCDIAESEGRRVGFALWFVNYSTWLGRHGLYLEDLFVRPEDRRLGAGRALLAHLAKRCIAEGYGRLDWAVLDWNEPAIRFYESLGVKMLDDWRPCRLTGTALETLAKD